VEYSLYNRGELKKPINGVLMYLVVGGGESSEMLYVRGLVQNQVGKKLVRMLTRLWQ
jgi:hypothetical protein